MKDYTEYELIYIIPFQKSEHISSINETVKKIITEIGGEVKKTSEPQKRRLAYPIKRVKTGIYIVSRVMLTKDSIKTLREKLKMEHDLLRYMLLDASELPEPKEESEAQETETEATESKKDQIKPAEEKLEKKAIEEKKPIVKEVATEIEKKVEEPVKEEIPAAVTKDKEKVEIEAKPEKELTEEKKAVKDKEKTKQEKEEEAKQTKIKLAELDKKIDDILKDDLL